MLKHEEVLRWCRASAEQGYASAQRRLGCRLLGHDFAVEGAPAKEGLHWLRAAAEQGDRDATYALSLACIARGQEASAEVWRSLAAELGHPVAQLSQAQSLLSLLDASTDPHTLVAQVRHLLVGAAKSGEEDAQRILAAIQARSFSSIDRLLQALCVWTVGTRKAHGDPPFSEAVAAADALWVAAARPGLLSPQDAGALVVQMTEAAPGELHITDLAAALWASTMLQLLPEQMMAIVSIWETSAISDLTPDTLAVSAWTFAHLHMRGLPGKMTEAVLPNLVLSIASVVSDLSADSLCDVVWSLATFKILVEMVAAEAAVKELTTALATKVVAPASRASFSTEDLAHSVWALVVLGVNDCQQLLKSLASELAARLRAGAALGQGDLEAAGWAFAAASGESAAEAKAFNFSFSQRWDRAELKFVASCHANHVED